jgi:hypothetical protein
MAARRPSICRRYPFQPIENQHVVGHSIERRLFATHFQVAELLSETFPPLPAAVPMLNTLAN